MASQANKTAGYSLFYDMGQQVFYSQWNCQSLVFKAPSLIKGGGSLSEAFSYLFMSRKLLQIAINDTEGVKIKLVLWNEITIKMRQNICSNR